MSLHKKITLFLSIIYLITLSLLTINRNSVWKNSLSLWSDVINKNFKNPRAHYNLGLAYKDLKKFNKSIEHFKYAIKYAPENYKHIARFKYNMGLALSETGKIIEAQKSYEDAINLDPQYYRAIMNLGNIFYKKQNYVKAGKFYERALSIIPGNVGVIFNLGLVSEKLGDLKKAKVLYQAVIKKSSFNKRYAARAMKLLEKLKRNKKNLMK